MGLYTFEVWVDPLGCSFGDLQEAYWRVSDGLLLF